MTAPTTTPSWDTNGTNVTTPTTELADGIQVAAFDGDLWKKLNWVLKWSAAWAAWISGSGASGSFTSADGKTVTVEKGIITSII